MSIFKLVSVSNQVIYNKLMNRNDFCFMNLLKSFTKETGLDETIIDIESSIKLINKENNLDVKAILYVEDEGILRDITQTFGEKVGHYIKTVPTAEKAESIIKKNPNLYSIVLLDKHLPGVDGDDFAIKLKQFSPNVQVCIVTGDKLSVRKDFVSNGIDRIIEKPLNFNIFKNTVGTNKKAA